MANDILKKIYYGEININETIIPQDSSSTNIDVLVNYFRKLLSADDFQKLDQLLSLDAASATCDSAERFILGVKLGFRLAMEILDKDIT